MLTWVLLVVGVLANAGASIMVKTAPPLDPAAPMGGLSWRLAIALAFYGMAFLTYAAAVQRMPLNVAHPIATAGAMLLVGLAAAFVFGEPFSPMRLLGYGLLAAGIAVLAISSLKGV